MPTEAPLRHPLSFLCIDPLAERADEDEPSRTHSKFCDRAKVLHGVAAGEAHYGRPPRRVPGASVRWRELRACITAYATPPKQAGALPNSQPPTPGTGPLSVMKHM